MKYLLLFIFIISSFFGLTSCTEFKNSQVENPVLMLDEDAPEILYARKNAQESLPSFLEALETLGKDSSYFFSVKADFWDGKYHEHMWVEIKYLRDTLLIGTLGNEPERITSVAFGDSIGVPLTEVEDWMIHDSRKDTTLGAFTIRAIGREDLLKGK